MIVMLFLILMFAIFRIVTLVTWLALAPVGVIHNIFGSLTGFVFLPLRPPVLSAPPMLLCPHRHLLSGIIVWATSSLASHGRTLLLLYVDDMIITGDDPEYIAFVKSRLSDQFLMSDLGPLRYFLEIEISSTPDGFFLSKEKYIQDLLHRASLTDHRTAGTPMELNVHLTPNDGEPIEDPTRYRHIVGSLVYLGVTSVHI
jgi:hypothetical protein